MAAATTAAARATPVVAGVIGEGMVTTAGVVASVVAKTGPLGSAYSRPRWPGLGGTGSAYSRHWSDVALVVRLRAVWCLLVALWWCFELCRAFPVEAMRRLGGAGCWLGYKRATDMVLPRESLHRCVGGKMTTPLWCRFSLLGHLCEAPCCRCTGLLRVKTLSDFGRATVAPLVSCPSWRCRIWSSAIARYLWLVDGVARA